MKIRYQCSSVGMLPKKVYSRIHSSMPIPGIDLMIYSGADTRNEEILIGLRKNEPGKGKWCIPGGRIFKGETVERAIHRIADDEANVICKSPILVGNWQYMSNADPFGHGRGTHTFTLVYAIRFVNFIKTKQSNIESQHDRMEWFNIGNPHDWYEHRMESPLRDKLPTWHNEHTRILLAMHRLGMHW